MNSIRFSFLISLFLLLATAIFAQNNSILIKGRLIEGRSQKPVEFATIILVDADTKLPITGSTSDENGQFEIDSPKKEVYFEFSFIGFQKKVIYDFKAENGKVDLGTVVLLEDSEMLDEVVVRAEKSQTEFRLDKRVFNVGKDLSSTGASALEVLNNVPSVNVNIEGQISLRGSSGVQILINGKPSVIASEQGNSLGTITADMIDQIEVITNPSAKYDAAGTSGIINIILKKEERKGINGSVSLNTGMPDNHSIGLSLNRRTEHFNLFSQLGAGYRSLPSKQENINQDLVTGTQLLSTGKEFRNEYFYNLILGTDYHINEWNVLTLSGNYALELEQQPSATSFRFVDANNVTQSAWDRVEETEATNPKWQYELQYKKQFEDHKEHTLQISALGRFFGKDQSSVFTNKSTFGNGITGIQNTVTNFKEDEQTFKLDYVHPFKEHWAVETGAQYVDTRVSNDFAVSNLENDVWIPDPNFTNIFDFNQKVLGVYGTTSYEDKVWGMKLGLRMEATDLETLLRTTNEENNRRYYNFFPTVHTSYKINSAVSVQAGYSRRIFRPGLWDLNPFFNIRNNFNIRTGNPTLLPELTDSYEVSSIYIMSKATLNASLYYRYTDQVIERIATLVNNVNLFRPENIGTNRTTGLEVNGKYSPNKWFTLNGDFNYNYFNRQGTLELTKFDFTANQWSSKLTSKFKLPYDVDFEVTGQYQSRVKTVQGVNSRNIFADMGLRKKMIKGKAVVSFSIRDIFASRIQETNTTQNSFYVYSFSQRGRFVTLGFSYGFGKGEAMEYSGQRRR